MIEWVRVRKKRVKGRRRKNQKKETMFFSLYFSNLNNKIKTPTIKIATSVIVSIKLGWLPLSTS